MYKYKQQKNYGPARLPDDKLEIADIEDHLSKELSKGYGNGMFEKIKLWFRSRKKPAEKRI